MAWGRARLLPLRRRQKEAETAMSGPETERLRLALGNALARNAYYQKQKEEEKAADVERMGRPDKRKNYDVNTSVSIYWSEEGARALLLELEKEAETK